MTGIAALLQRGRGGLDAPSPLEFAALVQPASPNSCLAAPAGHPGPKQLITPVLAGTPDAVFETMLALARDFPRTWQLAAWPQRRQAQWVERSALLNFPDIIVAECVTTPGGTNLFIYSRSLMGYSDLGANRNRVRRWLEALQAALPQAAPPPSRFAQIAVAEMHDQNVLLAWDDPVEMPEITLRAMAAGAASIQVMTPERPPCADGLLSQAGARLGLGTEAEGLLATRATMRDPLPPPLHADPGAWRAWWMRGSLDAPDLRERLPEVNVVLDGADLALLDGDPPRRLAGLKASGARRLVLRTSVVPATPELAALGFTLWHAGELDVPRTTILDSALRGLGVTLPQFERFPERLTRDAATAAGLEAPWWWFMNEAALENLLADAGWAIQSRNAQGHTLIVTATC